MEVKQVRIAQVLGTGKQTLAKQISALHDLSPCFYLIREEFTLDEVCQLRVIAPCGHLSIIYGQKFIRTYIWHRCYPCMDSK
jgi:hypothetical protein